MARPLPPMRPHVASRAAGDPEPIAGVADGQDLMLPNGVRFRLHRIGEARVSRAELLEAVRAVQLLPAADQVYFARTGIAIELIPVMQLEQLAGTSQPVLGATLLDSGRPRRLRIASKLAALGRPNTIAETVQHEIGHVLSVIRTGDRSEAAADAYAQRY